MNSQHPNMRLVLVAFAISVFTLSQAAVLVRLSAATPEVLGMWRMVFAVILSYLLVKTKKEKVINPFVKLHFQEIIWAGVLFFLHFWVWFHAVSRTTIANSTLLFCMNPLFVALAARFFHREKLTSSLILALILGLLGIGVMEWGAFEVSPEGFVGDIFAVVAAVAFAGYVLSTKKLRTTGSNYVLVFWFNVISLVGFTMVAVMSGHELLSYGWVSWVCFFGMAIGPSILGHALFSYSLKYLNAAVASCFVLLEPVFAAITAGWIFGETVKPQTIYGFIIISVGLVNLFLRELQSRAKKITLS